MLCYKVTNSSFNIIKFTISSNVFMSLNLVILTSNYEIYTTVTDRNFKDIVLKITKGKSDKITT